jgi:hypothetical protein
MRPLDIHSIRFVGGLIFGLGLVQMVLTLLVSLIALFGGATSSMGQLGHQLIIVGYALAMALAMIACGQQLHQANPRTASGVEDLRFIWAALLVVLILCCLAGAWLMPALGALAGGLVVGLFVIRGAIIRLSRLRP